MVLVPGREAGEFLAVAKRDRDASPQAGYLELEDGTVFPGIVFGSATPSDGEVVFNTGMVGYVESLSDPSYRGQILTLTYPLIGNYGVPHFENGSPRFESDAIQVRGLIVASYVGSYSHWESSMSLDTWLKQQNVVGLAGVDTRQLTKTLREKGTMLGRIVVPGDGASLPDPGQGNFNVSDPNATDLVREVTSDKTVTLDPVADFPEVSTHVVVVDCGCKRSIVQELRKRGCKVTVVPYDHRLTDMEYDGVMLSNGPGDPAMCKVTVDNVAELMDQPVPPPLAGICLGSQIMALAAGGRTFKLPYGHRSQNQPCREAGTNRCVITSQNHGYATDPGSLPEDWEIWFTNLNDSTVEGIRHRELPFFSVQFHPEASPGPTDSMGFFDSFVELMHNG